MPGEFNPNFNPAQVMMGNKPTDPIANPIRGPYMPTRPKKPGPQPPIASPIANKPFLGPSGPGAVLNSQAVRATGQGPYDNAYRQDLATYAGGGFQKPGGFLGLNPTGPLTGNPTGGGNAPVLGMPNDLLSMALGGQAFSFAPPQPTPAKSTNANAIQTGDWQKWLQGLTGNPFMRGQIMGV